jgi:hypothetical protein
MQSGRSRETSVFKAEWDSSVLGTPSHERLMLLELACDLERWPARNVVARKALDNAARQVAELASGSGTSPPLPPFGDDEAIA